MSAKQAPSRSTPLKRQETPLLVPKEIAPPIKTSVGITYAALSSAILAAVESTRANGQFGVVQFEKFKDALFLSPRLPQWEMSDLLDGYQVWRIYANDGGTHVSVDRKTIIIHRSLKERGEWVVTNDPLIVTSIFCAIEQAQAIVSTAVEEPVTDESYFEGEGYPSAGLDEALADTHVEPLSEDDAELIHDVTAEDALNEDQRLEDGPEPIVTVSQKFIDDIGRPFTEDISEKQYVGKTTVFVDAEVARVKEEYPELAKGQKSASQQGSGWTNFDRTDAMQHLKSLQGRILTIMDASIGDKEQRAAVKTLINKEFRQEITKLNGKEQSEK